MRGDSHRVSRSVGGRGGIAGEEGRDVGRRKRPTCAGNLVKLNKRSHSRAILLRSSSASLASATSETDMSSSGSARRSTWSQMNAVEAARQRRSAKGAQSALEASRRPVKVAEVRRDRSLLAVSGDERMEKKSSGADRKRRRERTGRMGPSSRLRDEECLRLAMACTAISRTW